MSKAKRLEFRDIGKAYYKVWKPGGRKLGVIYLAVSGVWFFDPGGGVIEREELSQIVEFMREREAER